MALPDAVNVRPAVVADLAAMERAKRQAGITAWPHIFPPEILGQLGFPERWAAVVTSPGTREAALVGELAGVVVGFAVTRPSGDDDASPDIGELDGFYVAPSSWRLGVGRALLAASLDRLRTEGFHYATLWTAVDNHRPRRIYEVGGWRPDGTIRRRELFGTSFDELRYRITL